MGKLKPLSKVEMADLIKERRAEWLAMLTPRRRLWKNRASPSHRVLGRPVNQALCARFVPFAGHESGRGGGQTSYGGSFPPRLGDGGLHILVAGLRAAAKATTSSPSAP